ncbi:MAG: response regulator [Candidatus Binatia bacterium]
MKPAARVFVIDDDADMREALQSLLESVGLEATTFPGAQQFLDRYDPATPGCMVLDIRMPGMSGLDLQGTLTMRGIDIPVIIVTGHAEVPVAVQALKSGAFDFIEKPFSPQLLLDRIRRALEVDTQRRQAAQERAAIMACVAELTPRERQVMDLVVAGKANKVIASELGLSPKTVEVHRAQVMRKMRVDSLAELVRIGLLATRGPADGH